MHAPYVLRTRTVSNAHGLYGVYDRSTALYGESPNAAVLEMAGARGCLLKLLPSLYAILFRYYPSILSAVSHHKYHCVNLSCGLGPVSPVFIFL